MMHPRGASDRIEVNERWQARRSSRRPYDPTWAIRKLRAGHKYDRNIWESPSLGFASMDTRLLVLWYVDNVFAPLLNHCKFSNSSHCCSCKMCDPHKSYSGNGWQRKTIQHIKQLAT